ncbi:hypothetical protein E1A91_D13G107500v1 [Gossypium mustelinum]|uniref:Trafficking protein particle complex subunit n=1 Tax=Gossypium mustelinum TaxID=34275 RepID=A0A5D2S0E3_GOSMU|nr:hypothetical protein E1A91_D13G107500v1 [Gossypium mustelinum]
MDTNDSLRVASLWHLMHAISQQLSPTTGCSKIELLEADTFDLHWFQSLTDNFLSDFPTRLTESCRLGLVNHRLDLAMFAFTLSRSLKLRDENWTKFFVVCEPGTQHIEALLKVVYELYTDYVLKNPFYEMKMPIRCELFDINLTQAEQKDRFALLG